MDPVLKAAVEEQLKTHRIMALATLRPDGWPQTTLVGYVSEGFRLYFVVAQTSQKFANISRDPRVSIAIGSDAPGGAARGLSMAARAHHVTDYGEIDRINRLVMDRYPQLSLFVPYEPGSQAVAAMCAVPEVISMIDHARGEGHADLVALVDGEWRPVGATPPDPG